MGDRRPPIGSGHHGVRALQQHDRVGTLVPALEGTAIVCWLLGSATGEPAALVALHGPRLRSFCEQLVDTGVRGLVYEAAGSVEPALLAEGTRIAREASETWLIPLRVLDADPQAAEEWLPRARAEVDALLAPG